MISVDTNVLARALLDDDPKQSPVARTLMEKADLVLVPVTVTVELAWVLKAVGWNRLQVHSILSLLAMQVNVRLDRCGEVLAALEDFRTGPADFADYLALQQSRALGAHKLVTFDRKLARASGAERLG
jgi:predicted nucleic-acid-binding protein